MRNLNTINTIIDSNTYLDFTASAYHYACPTGNQVTCSTVQQMLMHAYKQTLHFTNGKIPQSITNCVIIWLSALTN